jgi:hypothetical protein
MDFLRETQPMLRFEMNFRLNSLEVKDILDLLEEDLGHNLNYWGIGKPIPMERAKREIAKTPAKDFFYTSQFFYDLEMNHRLIISKVFPYISPGVLRISWRG